MSTSNKKRDTGCPVAFALDIFGDRWSLIIIRDILLKGYTSYSQLLSSDERISTNILASRLKELEESAILTKKKDPDNKRFYIYNITPKGIELAPIIIEMVQWSARYDSNTHVQKTMLEKIKEDKQGFIQNIQDRALMRTEK